ncbi:MAG TPA: hypothetical protein VEA63_13670, partial [Opitutus sp.]|nr:hypothetical protein [Opitutus sp.]
MAPTEHPHAVASHGTLFQFSRRALYFFGALLLLPWVVVGWLVIDVRAPRRSTTAASVPPTFGYDEYILKSKPGPWGELQSSRLLIEPPEEFMAAEVDASGPSRWLFPGYTPDQLTALWQKASLSPAQIALLDASLREAPVPNAILLEPPASLILELSPESRATIYTALSAFLENPAQNEPFRFR